MSRALFLFWILLAALCLPLSANAYIETSSGSALIVELSPKNPGPNQEVRAVINSYALDIDSSVIKWTVNGSEIGANTSPRSITFKTGELGSATILKVSAAALGKTGQKTITIRPASVDLVWQGNNYVPTGYQGKTLTAAGSQVEVVALSHFVDAKGLSIKPESLVYEWQKDFQRIGNASGLGKNTFNLTLGNQTSRVDVTVSTADRQLIADANINIKPTAPKLLIYEQHPLNGLMLNKTLSKTFHLEKDELTIQAEPFYFTLPANTINTDGFKFGWKLNNKTFASGAAENNTATIRRPETAGQTKITISAENPTIFNQQLTTLLDILFNQP